MSETSSPGHPSDLPVLITMGDPAGIGPEIIARAVRERPDLLSRVVVAGDVGVLAQAVGLTGGTGQADLRLMEVGDSAPWVSASLGALRVVQACSMREAVPFGQVSAAAGAAAAQCIAYATQQVLLGRARALVTAPIHKEALAAAGIGHPGHTELLQSLCAAHAGVSAEQMPVRMMLSCPGLATVLVSIHVPLRQALEAVTRERVLDTLRITARHFSRCGLPHARIAVAGLNPHAGEGGLFGREEIDAIAPAIEQAKSEGMDVSGPHAPDTVFMRARQGAFDAVVAMYHDQGLIPVKLMGLDHGVNTTLGLPLIRTSPDHGTAFDLAGTGRASAASLLAALEAALRMSAVVPTDAVSER
jgi:4-hydroxythreonine-4-phosphate dehydrogenase